MMKFSFPISRHLVVYFKGYSCGTSDGILEYHLQACELPQKLHQILPCNDKLNAIYDVGYKTE